MMTVLAGAAIDAVLAAPPLPADPRAAKAVQDYLSQQQAQESKDGTNGLPPAWMPWKAVPQ